MRLNFGLIILIVAVYIIGAQWPQLWNNVKRMLPVAA